MPLPTVGQVITILPVAPVTEKRQGICKFVGETQFSDGLWVGVELIGSAGKNNGTVNGVQYFNCEPGKGVFIRPELVEERSSETTMNDAESSKQSEEIRAQLEDVTMQLGEKTERVNQLIAQVEVLELDLEILTEEKEGMKEDLDLALEDLEIMKGTTDDDLQLRVETLQKENAKLTEENEELREMAEAEAASSSIIESLQDTKMELEEKNDALLKSLNQLRAQYDELQTFSTMQDEELAEQKEELQMHDEEMELVKLEHSDRLEAKDTAYTTLKGQLLKLEKDVEDLTASSSDNQQELAVQLRLLKEQNSDAIFKSVWDTAATESFNQRFQEKAMLTAAVQAAVPPLSVPLSRASSYSLSRHSRSLVTALLSPEVASVRRSHHIEAAIGLSAFHLKLDSIAAGSATAPLSSAQCASLEEVLLRELVRAGHQSAQGVDHWRKVFARLQDIGLPRAASGSMKNPSATSATTTSKRSSYITAAGAEPLVNTLHFLVKQGCEMIENLKSTLQTYASGEGAMVELLSQMDFIHTALATSFDPLTGVEKAMERVGGHNILWTADGSQTLLLAVSEAHTLVLPLLSMVERSKEVVESVKRGLATSFWSGATEQIFAPLIKVGASFSADTMSILTSSTNFWLPPTERGLQLKQLGNTIASGSKKLWNMLETAQQVSPAASEGQNVNHCVAAVTAELKDVQAADGVLSAEQAKEAVSAVQKQLDDTTGLKDKALYEVEAQRARCKELENHVSRLKKSEAELSHKINRVTSDYQTAFDLMESDNAKVQDELKRHKKLVQAASSVAPLSQWERRQMKHTIEVYRAAAANSGRRSDVILTSSAAAATGSMTSADEEEDDEEETDLDAPLDRNITHLPVTNSLSAPLPKALRQQHFASALEWSTPTTSLLLVGV